MGLESEESVEFIDDLVVTWPTAEDFRRHGDDHMRNIKKAIRNTFSAIKGAVNPTHKELNTLVGIGTDTVADQLAAKADAVELENYGPLAKVNRWQRTQRTAVQEPQSIPSSGNVAELGDMSLSNSYIFQVDDDISSWTWDEGTIRKGATYQIFLDVTDSDPVNITWPDTFRWPYGVAPVQLQGGSRNLLTLVSRTTSWFYVSLAEQFS